MDRLANGQLVETLEEVQSAARVRAFHFAKYHGEDWLKPVAPVKAEHDGIYQEHTVVIPRPSSKERRFATKPQHKAKPPRACLECPTMISGASPRCPDHRRAHRKMKQDAAQKIIYARNHAAKCVILDASRVGVQPPAGL